MTTVSEFSQPTLIFDPDTAHVVASHDVPVSMAGGTIVIARLGGGRFSKSSMGAIFPKKSMPVRPIHGVLGFLVLF